MDPQHRDHLVSLYTTVLDHLEEIRRLATTGRTPGGARVAPLPEAKRAELLALLERLEQGLGELMRRHVPDYRQPAPRGAATARMWLGALLREVEGLVADADPGRMSRRYGELPAAEQETLQADVDDLLAELRQGLAQLD